MHRVSSRRSACDRCRSHKLRCVRLDQNPNSASATGGPDTMMPCQRCLKAGTNCVRTAQVTGKSTGENDPARRVSTCSGRSATSYQQRPPAADQQLKDFPIDISAQASPQVQRKSRGPGPGKSASPQWQMFAQPSSRPRLESPKPPHLASHDSRPDHRLPEPPTSLITPPASDKAHRSSDASYFDMDEMGLESRGFGPISSLLHDNTGTSQMLDYSTEPLVPSSFFDTAANVMAGQSLHEQQMLLPGSTTDDCLQRLSQLSSKLLMDFGKASPPNMEDVMPFLSSPIGTSTSRQDGTNGTMNSYLSSTVGKLFESLQVYLETVERLRPYPNSSSASECSYSDQWDEPELVSTTDDNQLYQGTTLADHIHDFPNARQSAGERAGTHPFDNPRPFDMPATLTILTCYTWLLKGYEMVLSGIQDTLASQDRLQGLKPLPSIFHGSRIGNFALEDHPDMQIEIVIHIGSQLLHRIEGVLGIHVVSERSSAQDGQGDRREILDTNSAAALLGIWFAKGGQGENHSGDPCGGRRIQINHTVENIRRLLREYWRDFRGK